MIAAFHLLCEGKAAYTPAKGMENRWHVIGPGDNPIYVCRKGDVPKLFSDEFVYVYEVWRCFHYTQKFPDGQSWLWQDPQLIDSVVSMENHYTANFGNMGVVIKYLEAILKKRTF